MNKNIFCDKPNFPFFPNSFFARDGPVHKNKKLACNPAGVAELSWPGWSHGFLPACFLAVWTSTDMVFTKGQKSADKLKNRVFHKHWFFHYFELNWGGLGVSRVTARTIRRHRRNFSRDLILHGIRKSTFHDFRNFNVLEMVSKPSILSRVSPGHL